MHLFSENLLAATPTLTHQCGRRGNCISPQAIQAVMLVTTLFLLVNLPVGCATCPRQPATGDEPAAALDDYTLCQKIAGGIWSFLENVVYIGFFQVDPCQARNMNQR